MRDQDRALTLAEQMLKAAAGADQAQVTVTISDASYARFARNYVVQNLGAVATQITLTYYVGKRSGSISTDETSPASMARTVARARAIALRVPPDSGFVSLPKPGAIAPARRSYYDATADATPDDRVEKLLPLFARMNASQLSSSGFTTTQINTVAVANSLGVRAAFTGTMSGLQLKAMAEQTSGFAEFYSPDYSRLDPQALAERAATKATLSRVPATFAPGNVTVLLEPSAFAAALKALTEGMGADDVLEEKDSWMVGRIGHRLFSPNVTLRDDWSHPLFANPPFNPQDGVPTEKLTLIDSGVVKHFVSNTYSANKYHVANTGHPNFPANGIVEPGTKSRDALLASIERGVLISRTWYERVVDPRQATITGITRDGVYLIENGKLTKTLKNFRYFVSMIDAFKNIEFSNTQVLTEPDDDTGYSSVLPDAKIANYHLAAQTSFA
ncbi:MAG TPA: TldD/PmbA family protein [Candidatus Lustribacter sp.]|nr:TldD/PmbA family protein [Candidatus Lustribacter sp.]